MKEINDYQQSDEFKIENTKWEIYKTLDEIEKLLQPTKIQNRVYKIWRVHPSDVGPCPFCVELNGISIGYFEKFENKGYEFFGPPAHKGCRCFIEKNEEQE